MLKISDILILVAHPDDEILALGGSIKYWIQKGKTVKTLIFTDGKYPSEDPKLAKIRQKESENASKILGHSIEFLSYPDFKLNQHREQITKDIRKHIKTSNAVFTHFSGDTNPDHKALAEITSQTLRPGSVDLYAEIETPSATERATWFTNTSFIPNCYIDIQKTLNSKLQAWDQFKSQDNPKNISRSRDGISHHAATRGAAINSPAAEAIKIIYSRVQA